MEPARLARSWMRRLPGVAVLALDRTVPDLAGHRLPVEAPQAEAAPEQGAGEPVTPHDAPLTILARGLRRRSQTAVDHLRATRAALGRADGATAAAHLVDARDAAATLTDPLLDAWIALFAAELAHASGAVEAAAGLSCLAEDAARRAGDEPTFLAVVWVRALRALRRGFGGEGELMAQWIDARLDAAAPVHRHRLRCYAAAFALDDERPADAIATVADLVTSAPGTTEAALAAALVTQAFLALGRPTDAARVATSAIVGSPAVPPRVRARLYLDASLALEACDAHAEAARCAALASRLAPDVDADATLAELDGVGVEAALL